MHWIIYSNLKQYIIKAFIISLLFLWCGIKLEVRASFSGGKELQQPTLASISHSSAFSDLDAVVQQWGRETAVNNGFRWVELYQGTKEYPDAKIKIIYKDTKYSIDEKINQKITRYDIYREFFDNRLGNDPSPTVITHTQALNSTYRYAITKGLNAGMSVNATIPTIPVGVGINFNVSFSSVKEDTRNSSHSMTVAKTITVPSHTASLLGLTIRRDEYAFPFISDLCLIGDVVLCTKKVMHFNNKDDKNFILQRGAQESAETDDKTENELFLTSQEEEILNAVEQKYPHFPNIPDEEIKNVQEYITQRYSILMPQAEKSSISSENENNDLDGTGPRSISFMKKLFRRYKFEVIPITTVIRQYFTNHPQHPDKQDYIVDEDKEEVIFKAKGIIQVSQETDISGGILKSFHKDKWPINNYSKKDLEEESLKP